MVGTGLIGALSESCSSSSGYSGAPPRLTKPGTLINGNLKVNVTSTMIAVTRMSDGRTLLSGMLPNFGRASCGIGFSTFTLNLTAESGNKWYGLGQLENPDQSSCNDGTPNSLQCGSPLNRAGANWTIHSTKYQVRELLILQRAPCSLVQSHKSK